MTHSAMGTAVMVLAWHNPVMLAEQAATLDLISNGRLELGIGKGDTAPPSSPALPCLARLGSETALLR